MIRSPVDAPGASTLVDIINNDGMQGETMSALPGPFYRGRQRFIGVDTLALDASYCAAGVNAVETGNGSGSGRTCARRGLPEHGADE